MEHSILIAVWHILTNDVEYADLGGDYFGRLDPERAMHRIVRQVNALGFNRALRPDPDRLTTHTTLAQRQQHRSPRRRDSSIIFGPVDNASKPTRSPNQPRVIRSTGSGVSVNQPGAVVKVATAA